MRNPGIPFNESIINSISVQDADVAERIAQLSADHPNRDHIEDLISWLDLTSLSATDTPESIEKLLERALVPSSKTRNTVAAVCLYQPFIARAIKKLEGTGVGIATVAGGFPAGQMDLSVKCADIERSVSLGATEIDAVISRAYPLTQNWEALHKEVEAFRKSCGTAKLKVIIATGDLGDYTTIARTSMVCMMAGADFIKTSTGMEKVNATLETGFAMMISIKLYLALTGYMTGFKPAGGIRTKEQAMLWRQLVKEELGDAWLNKNLFRIGASALLDDLSQSL
jgi:deoxyribose-phosphate aldolase